MIKTVLVTGATAGIGEACAHKFAQNGWKVIITGRRSERLDVLKGELEEAYSAVVATLNFDVRSLDAVRKALAELKGDWRNIDLLVNNAGLALGTEPFDQCVYEDWEQMIDTNIKGLLYMTRELVPEMIARGKGHIINIASMAGHEVYPGGNVYCATKHAVLALSKGMRMDLVDRNIKVSTVSPGAVETEFSIVRYKGDVDRADSKYEGFEPLTAHDIAESVYFVASQPEHVNIEEIYLCPKAQASPFMLHREE